MAMSWSRVADFAQRGMAVALFGLTVYGMVVLTQGATACCGDAGRGRRWREEGR